MPSISSLPPIDEESQNAAPLPDNIFEDEEDIKDTNARLSSPFKMLFLAALSALIVLSYHYMVGDVDPLLQPLSADLSGLPRSLVSVEIYETPRRGNIDVLHTEANMIIKIGGLTIGSVIFEDDTANI